MIVNRRPASGHGGAAAACGVEFTSSSRDPYDPGADLLEAASGTQRDRLCVPYTAFHGLVNLGGRSDRTERRTQAQALPRQEVPTHRGHLHRRCRGRRMTAGHHHLDLPGPARHLWRRRQRAGAASPRRLAVDIACTSSPKRRRRADPAAGDLYVLGGGEDSLRPRCRAGHPHGREPADRGPVWRSAAGHLRGLSTARRILPDATGAPPTDSASLISAPTGCRAGRRGTGRRSPDRSLRAFCRLWRTTAVSLIADLVWHRCPGTCRGRQR